MEFRCRLAAATGDIVEGVYAAESESRLRHEFEEKGLYVLSLQQKGAIGGLSFHLPNRTTIPSREFLIFNQELATLLKAGMPLVQSLDLLRGRIESPVFQSLLNDVHERVRAGAALSDAFGAHDTMVPSIYTASLVAGERSGNLDAVLRRFVEYTKVIQSVKRKIVSALVYPAILISLALVLVSIIVLKVVPAFSDFYQSFGAQLPLATRAIVAISAFLRGEGLRAGHRALRDGDLGAPVRGDRGLRALEATPARGDPPPDGKARPGDPSSARRARASSDRQVARRSLR